MIPIQEVTWQPHPHKRLHGCPYQYPSWLRMTWNDPFSGNTCVTQSHRLTQASPLRIHIGSLLWQDGRQPRPARDSTLGNDDTWWRTKIRCIKNFHPTFFAMKVAWLFNLALEFVTCDMIFFALTSFLLIISQKNVLLIIFIGKSLKVLCVFFSHLSLTIWIGLYTVHLNHKNVSE